MILSQLLIAGGISYLGVRIYQRNRKSPTLMDGLVADQPHQPAGSISKTDLLVSAGAIAVGSALWITSATGLTPLLFTNRLIDLLSNNPYAPALYLSAYAVRPLTLFPASLLTLAGGLLFGPVGGILYTVVGSNLSALIAYSIGKRLGGTSKPDSAPSSSSTPNWQVLEPYVEQMQANPFATILTTHLLFLPYDLVNYGAGVLGLPWQPFLLATALGSLPGTVAFALAGASVQSNTITGVPTLNPVTLAASGLIFVSSLAFSRYLSQRQQSADSAEFQEIPISY